MHFKQLLRFTIGLSILFFPAIAFAHGISEADQHSMLSGGLIRYMWLGETHMLTGYDHLLFIFGVIFFLTGFRDIVKYITAFTLGHSITLIFATVFNISANYLMSIVFFVPLLTKQKRFELSFFCIYIGLKP